jgi:hypothetical protein
MVHVPNADTVFDVEGNTSGSDIASLRPVRRGLRPWHVRTLFVREPGDLGFGREAPRPASGRRGAEADDERALEV